MSVAVETASVKPKKEREDGSFGVFCWTQFSMLKRGGMVRQKAVRRGQQGLYHKGSFEH